MNEFLADFKRTLNIKTPLTILTVTALCFFSHLANSGETNPITILEHLINSFGNEKNTPYYQEIILSFDTSYWFNIVLPVILSTGVISDFYTEWFGGGYYFNISRRSILSFCFSKSAAYSLNSAMCFLAGLGLFIIPVITVFPSMGSEELQFFYSEGFFVYILPKILNYTAVAILYPLFSVIMLILIKEKFLALSVPLLIGYVSGNIGAELSRKAAEEGNPQLYKITAFLPYYQSVQWSSFERNFGVPIFVWYICWALIYALHVFCFYRLVKRREK